MTCNGMAFFPANFMLQPSHEDEHQQPQASLNPILSSCTPQDFHGVASFLGKRSASFSGIEVSHDHNHHHHHQPEGSNMGEDELSDDGSMAGEKKRRLNMEQVKTLEKNFELGNKLEPERKMQLARALGLQPRQVAIWFQNRRARWKTKQLEKDYDILKRQFEAVKADNEALQAHNQKLHAEILALKSRDSTESINLNKETDQGSCSNRSENSSEIKLDMSRAAPAIDSPIMSNNNNNINHPITSRPLFPPSSSTTSSSLRPPPPPPNVVAQVLFQTNPSSRPDPHHQNIQFQKLDQMVKEESLTNMFCGIDDQTAFWPWLEQNHFN